MPMSEAIAAVVFDLDGPNVVCTPHLGASTHGGAGKRRAANRRADVGLSAARRHFNAVNFPSISAEETGFTCCGLARHEPESGLVGSGLIVVNPPFLLERELRVLLPALARWLAPTGTYRLDWLSRE
jgi:hypothetical protein